MLCRIALGLAGLYLIVRCNQLGPWWIQARINSTGEYMPPIAWKTSPLIPIVFGIVFMAFALFEKRLESLP